MAKTIRKIDVPKITLNEAITELSIINSNLFNFKIGTIQLIEAIEADDLKKAKLVIEIFSIKEVIKNLEPKDS